jgi:hypothetical protein
LKNTVVPVEKFELNLNNAFNANLTALTTPGFHGNNTRYIWQPLHVTKRCILFYTVLLPGHLENPEGFIVYNDVEVMAIFTKILRRNY